MSEKIVFEFERHFEGGYIPVHIGRLTLKSGNGVRIFFTSEGVKIMIPTTSKDNGDIIWQNQNETFIGLGNWERKHGNT